MYYFKLTGIFQNWCQSLLWIDYILSYLEVDSFPFFTKNALTMGKIRYLWCTCSIARIQTSIWVTEVTGSTQNIILCFQWKRIILTVWKNFIIFTTEKKFDFRNEKYKYVEYNTPLKSTTQLAELSWAIIFICFVKGVVGSAGFGTLQRECILYTDDPMEETIAFCIL